MIALKISGNKSRYSGFTPLVGIGMLAGNDNLDRVPLVNEKPSYVVRHAPDYTLYMLIDQNVRAFDTDTSGRLSIALTIPSNMQLQGDASPLQILKEAYEAFTSSYMTLQADGRHAYKDIDIDSMPFREIVSKYSLEPRISGYVTMPEGGFTGVLRVPADKMNDFFRNTQYPEFNKFKDIEVGLNCAITPGLENLQIPLPMATYKVMVNGQEKGELHTPADSFTASAAPSITHTYDDVTFSLDELLKAPNGILSKDGAIIKIYKNRQIIDCKLKSNEIPYHFKFEIGGNADDKQKQEVEKAFNNGKLKINIDRDDLTKDIVSGAEVLPSKISNRRVVLSNTAFNNCDLTIKVIPNNVSRQYIINVNINKRMAVGSGGKVPGGNGGNNNGGGGMNNNIGGMNNNIGGGMTPFPPEQPESKTSIKALLLAFFVGVLVGGALIYFVGKALEPEVYNNSGDVDIHDEISTTDNGKTDPAEDINNLNSVDDALLVKQRADSIEKAKNDSIELANKKAKLELEQAQKLAKEEAEKRNKEQAERNEKETKRKEVLALINETLGYGFNDSRRQTNLVRLREQWKNVLTTKEILASEAVLNTKQYRGNDRKNVEKFLQGKTFDSFNDILAAQQEIIKIVPNK